MTSKQEKLAAARKKLKEFQGKQKESNFDKMKNINKIMYPQTVGESTRISNESSPSCTPVLDSNKIFVSEQSCENQDCINSSNNNKNMLHHDNACAKFPYTGTSKSSFSVPQNINLFCKENDTAENQDRFNEGRPNLKEVNSHSAISYEPPMTEIISNDDQKFHRVDTSNYHLTNVEKCSEVLKINNLINSKALHSNNSSHTNSNICEEENLLLYQNEGKSMKSCSISTPEALDEFITPLQNELQNHAQTIHILVQQRNEAQNMLLNVQSQLSGKSEEISMLQQHISNLTAATTDLKRRLTESEALVKNLLADKEEKEQKIQEIKSENDRINTQFECKEEEYSEYKRKYEQKSIECQHLILNLNNLQNQLSFYQIQPSADNPNINSRLTELESENLGLKQDIQKLENQLEDAYAENEKSGVSFKVYAQQCNSQLSVLNEQVKNLTLENEKLKQINGAMISNLSDIQSLEEHDTIIKNFKSEIADLHDQISSVNETNGGLEMNIQELKTEISILKSKLREKEIEIEFEKKHLKEMKIENNKLLEEVETPKPNERLLAAIESDKVAAAKAVAQNQKLKSQVQELEEAFVKINEEKLELTDKLSHEKHKNKELQSRLDSLKSKSDIHDNCSADYHNHQHDNHSNPYVDKSCSVSDESICSVDIPAKPEPLVNDSHEMDELRNIIRQLQDDKMELTERLNSFVSSNDNYIRKRSTSEKSISDFDEDEYEGKHENMKLRLRQMEEKVRKTMNEIAILDEEKEKLEHLVVQLQGETETIGEYITLYQKQRMLLNQRAQEKDNQLIQLSKDKEELKSKLKALDELVQRMLKEKNNSDSGGDVKSITSEAQVSENTAGQIRALISEIGSTNLVSTHSVAFKHCSCCSGRLMTI